MTGLLQLPKAFQGCFIGRESSEALSTVCNLRDMVVQDNQTSGLTQCLSEMHSRNLRDQLESGKGATW